MFINKKPLTYFSVCSLPKIHFKVNVLILNYISVLFQNVVKIRDFLVVLIISNILYFPIEFLTIQKESIYLLF